MTNEIKETAEAIAKVGETFPIYQDLMQPAVRELGKGLHTLSKTIHIALSPVSAMVWGYDKIKDYVLNSLEEKLKNVPKENIKPPSPEIAVPTLEAMRYAGYIEELREMFSNLLATSMNEEISEKAHPSFVEIIKQINSDEAKILKLLNTHYSKPVVKMKVLNKDVDHYAEPISELSMLPYQAECDNPELGPSYLVNLQRLGLIRIEYDTYNTFDGAYDELFNHNLIKKYQEISESLNKRSEIIRGTINRTKLGEKFYDACIKG